MGCFFLAFVRSQTTHHQAKFSLDVTVKLRVEPNIHADGRTMAGQHTLTMLTIVLSNIEHDDMQVRLEPNHITRMNPAG